jgi:hypothetical protein
MRVLTQAEMKVVSGGGGTAGGAAHGSKAHTSTAHTSKAHTSNHNSHVTITIS